MIPRDENNVPIGPVAAAGEVPPATNNVAATTGGADYVFAWKTPVNHVLVHNRTGADAYYRLDKACTGVCTLLADKAIHLLDIPCTTVHWYTAANQTMLTETAAPTAAGLVTIGWL